MTTDLKRIALLCISIAMLSACAVPSSSNLFQSEPEKDYSQMYLRGVFNWWEAGEAFKFTQVSKELFIVDVELIADGQPYDFKVADKNWAPLFNCGLAEESTPMALSEAVELYCFNDSLNLKFTPNETAIYRFELDVSNNQYPELRVSYLDI
jgi:hypothetical protein